MLVLLITACSWFAPSGPPEPPERWHEVVALADLAGCRASSEPPDTLQDLVTWHSAPEHAEEYIPGLALYSLLGLSSDTVLKVEALTDAEAASIAKAVSDAERCGALLDVMVTKVIREQSCGTTLHDQLGDRPGARPLAAREAISQWQLIASITDDAHRSRAFDETAIARDWQDWVLDPAGPSPTGPKVSKEAGVGGEVLGEGISRAWNEYVSGAPCAGE